MAESPVIRVGIVGSECNADYHIRYSRAYPGAQLVGMVEEKARDATDSVNRFGSIRRFVSLKDLVEHEKPDVLHIVSAPTSHFRLVREAIESGCHVIVESPVALNREDAAFLYELAERRAVKLCAMDEHRFEPRAMRAREVIESGRVGGVAQNEYYRSVDPRMPALREYPAPNVLPWLYELPGGVYHYFLVSPLYTILRLTGRSRNLK